MSDSMLSVLGRVPSGIFILTIRSGQQETGMLASWVMQAGFEPPMVSVAVKLGRYVGQWMDEKCPFVLNMLGEGPSPYLKHFGRGFEPGEPAFEGLEIERTENEVPILRDVLGHLECTPVSSTDSGDHRIFLARITGGRLNTEDKPYVHIRKTGANY